VVLSETEHPFQPVWRYIPLLQAPGAMQMALDAYLLQQHCEQAQPAILRFYIWQPIALSLGYHQRQFPNSWKTLSWQDEPIQLVRRPTGGRSVLHQGDLTYAVITSGISGKRSQVYARICQFLIEAWRSLSIDLHFGQAGRGYIHQPNCFATATAADLLLPNGIKLIGSAQFRQGHAVLQHGSIRLCPDRDLFNQVFAGDSDPQPAFQMGYEQCITLLIPALLQAAEQCFHAKLICEPLSADEWQAVQALSPKFVVA